MKIVKFLSVATIAGSMFFTSCGNNKNEKTDSKTDSTQAKATAPEMLDAVLVRHKVADFNKWKDAYEQGDSMRMAAGMHNYVIARGTEDSNMVFVSMRIEDTARANAFMANPNLKKIMHDAGVQGEPWRMTVHRVFEDSSTNNIVNRVMVSHKVKDYDAWRKAFDEGRQARKDNGLTDRIIAQDVTDKNNVVIFLAITDAAKAKAFMNSKDLKATMEKAGVVGAPSVYMYTVVKKY